MTLSQCPPFQFILVDHFNFEHAKHYKHTHMYTTTQADIMALNKYSESRDTVIAKDEGVLGTDVVP